MSINKAIISGNLTRDPETRATAGGTTVLNFGVAVNERVKSKQSGEWEDRPNFIDCVMFGTRAEAVSRFISKGTKVTIEGKLRWSQWETDGQKRSKIEVVVDEIEFMSRQQNATANPNGAQPVYQQPAQQQMQGMPAPVVQAPSIYDEDIPF